MDEESSLFNSLPSVVGDTDDETDGNVGESQTSARMGMWQRRNLRRKNTESKIIHPVHHRMMGSEAGADGNSERSWRKWCKSRWTLLKPSAIPPAPKTQTRNTWSIPQKLRAAFVKKPQPHRPDLQVYIQTRNTNWTRFFRRADATAGPVAESGAVEMNDMDDLDDVQGEHTLATPSEASIGSQIAPLGYTPFDGRTTQHDLDNIPERINLNMGEASARLRGFADLNAIPESATQVSLEQPRNLPQTPVQRRERREESPTASLNRRNELPPE